MDIRHPNAAEVAELTGRISAAFGYTIGEPGVARDFPQLYQANNFQHLYVAREKNKIVAHAGFYPATMKVEGFPLPVAGIGGVYTDEAKRGQGLATKLIEKCVEDAKRGGAALAFLWSDQHEFYKKSGFHLVGRQWTLQLQPAHVPALRALGEQREIPARALRIVDEPVGEEFLLQSHALLNQYPLGIARTLEEHSLYLKSGSGRVISAWAGRQLAAYFVIGKGRDLQGYIHEWAGAEGALHHLAAQCLEDFGQNLFLLSPQFMMDEVPWIYSLDEAGVPTTAEYLALVKILDFEKVQKLTQEFVGRIGLNPADLRLERAGEDFTVIWRNQAPRRLDEAGLLGLLFGPELPEEKELQAFLPMRLWYWGMDSV